MAHIVHYHHPLKTSDYTLYHVDSGVNLADWVNENLPASQSLAITVNFHDLATQEHIINENDVISLRPAMGFGIAWFVWAMMALAVASAVYTVMNMPDSNSQDTKKASSVYNYNAQGNQPKLGNPVKVQYGRMPDYPDIITPSWWEYVGNEQFVYQQFSKGVGRFLIHDHYIGETKISEDNQDVEVRVYQPGELIDHFDHIVWTSKEVGSADGNGGLALEGVHDGYESSVNAKKTEFSGKNIRLFDAYSHNRRNGRYVEKTWPWKKGQQIVIHNSTQESQIFEGNVSFIDMGDDGDVINPTSLPDQIECLVGWDFVNVGMSLVINGAGVNSGVYKVAKKINDNRIEVTSDTDIPVSLTSMSSVFLRIYEAMGNDGLYICENDSGRMALVGSDNWLGFTTLSSETAVLTVSANDQESAWIGDFMAAPLDATPLDIGLDFVWPRGLGEMNDNGTIINRSSEWEIRVRKSGTVDEYKTHTISLTKSDNTPQRMTYWLSNEMSLPPGMYDVGCRRITPFTDSTRIFDEVQWMGLKSVIAHTYKNPHETIITLKIKATNALSQQANQQYWCDSTRIIPVRQVNGTFTDKPSRSIADAVIDACRNKIYGAGIGEDGIDYDTLLAYREKWQKRGDSCDGLFDSPTGFWDAIGQILQTGRAYPRLDFGSVSMWRDEPRAVLCKPYSPVNMLQDSFTADISLVEQDDNDGVEIEWFNPLSRKSETILCCINGQHGYNPKSLKMPFITNEKQARKEGMFSAACQAYRRTSIKFSTDIDGWESNYGDMVPVAHDAVCWGQSGQLLESKDLSGSQYLRLTGLLEWEPGKTHYLLFNDGNRGAHGPYRVAQTAESDIVILLDKPTKPIFEVGEQGEQPSQYMFGIAEQMYKRCILQQVRQKGEFEVSCQAIEDDPRVDAYA